ncbi:MAG: LssY C-terminal domain-containing protein [Gammaproteobacteria bacterium]|nr:LssY C-terminal domain-containing protein [Gammaproteobacteria bacterium]
MDNHYFHLILIYLRLHPHMGELFTFLVAFSESLPLIGTVIPGSVTMTLVGILIGTGIMPPAWTLSIASAAAFCGDSIGYAVGFHFNDRLRIMWPFKKHPKWLLMGEAFFKKHGGKSIVLGRFIGPARCMVPMIAGLLRLTWLRFMIAALPSAILWALVYISPGILVGVLAHEAPKGEATEFLLYGVAVIVVLGFIFWLIQHFFMQLTRIVNNATNQLWAYMVRKNTGRFLIRLISNQQNPDDHHQLTLLLSGIVSGILFLILFFNVRHHGVMTTLNEPIFHLLQNIRTLTWNKIFVVITVMGAPKSLMLISLLATAFLLIQKQMRAAAHLIGAFILCSGAVYIFKKLSYSPRPQDFNLVASSFSFPSGHTTLSLVIVGFIAFLLTPLLSKNNRWIPITFSSMFIASVAFSRLYLGAHWFSDIVGSCLLGLCILFLCIISYRRMPKIAGALQLSTPAIILLLLFSFGVAWSINITEGFTTTLYDTTPAWAKQKINTDAWWQSPLNYTPIYRNNRLGKPFQPFNVQWQGSLDDIIKTLKNNGWETISNQELLKLIVKGFGSHNAENHMPILPWLYHNKIPQVLMIKHIPYRKRIIELRLWQSDIHFQPGNAPLWIGSTDIRISPKILFSLKAHTTISLRNSGGLNVLYHDTHQFQQKYIQVAVDPSLKKIEALHWDGKILLVKNVSAQKLGR